jgi:hypothetical protein
MNGCSGRGFCQRNFIFTGFTKKGKAGETPRLFLFTVIPD